MEAGKEASWLATSSLFDVRNANGIYWRMKLQFGEKNWIFSSNAFMS